MFVGLFHTEANDDDSRRTHVVENWFYCFFSLSLSLYLSFFFGFVKLLNFILQHLNIFQQDNWRLHLKNTSSCLVQQINAPKSYGDSMEMMNPKKIFKKRWVNCCRGKQWSPRMGLNRKEKVGTCLVEINKPASSYQPSMPTCPLHYNKNNKSFSHA